MRKRIAWRKLGRTSSHKMAMLRNMVTSLIKHERIQTTEPKAKELRTLADKVIGHAKKGNSQIGHILELNQNLYCNMKGNAMCFDPIHPRISSFTHPFFSKAIFILSHHLFCFLFLF